MALRYRLFLLWIACALTVASHAGDVQRRLDVAFETNAVVVRNAAPGTRIAFFSITREMTGALKNVPTLVRRSSIITDEDLDGTIRFEVATPVPHIGLWVVVDLISGASKIIPVPGFEPNPIAVSEFLKNDNVGQLRKVDWPSSELDLMVVRPGHGAWRMQAAKYAAVDENKNPAGPMRVDASTLAPVGNTPAAPQTFRNGDVLVLVDPFWLRYAIVEVGK